MKAAKAKTADIQKTIRDILQKQFAPVYVLDGEEEFYLDKIMDLLESNVLNETEKDFNQTILYGKETSWQEIITACRRFPMFAEKQLVIVKDAGAVDGYDNLKEYVSQPAPTTVFVLEFRNKKLDSRTNFAKIVENHAVYVRSEKIKEDAMPRWISQYCAEQGFQIHEKEANMLTLYLGNDLKKIANEIEKIRINLPDAPVLLAEHIQKYIGISREYDLFEFASCYVKGDKARSYRMLSYFISNVKAAPMVLVTMAFYTQFNQLYRSKFISSSTAPNQIAGILGMGPYFVKDYLAQTAFWRLEQVEAGLEIIAEYNSKAVGIKSVSGDTALLMEMMGRLEYILDS